MQNQPPEVFYKNAFLKEIHKETRLFLYEAAGLRPATKRDFDLADIDS